MKKWRSVLLVVLFGCWQTLTADSYPRDPSIDVRHYRFEISVSDHSEQITAKAAITVRFSRPIPSSFFLDLIGPQPDSSGMIVKTITENGRSLPFRHADNRINILLDSSADMPGERTFLIDYLGTPSDGLIRSPVGDGNYTFFGDNWPDRARNWLPSIDHPSDKATCEFIVTAPSKYQVVANGRLMEETDLANRMRRTHWKTMAPIPTKVMVIGVAQFAVRKENFSGIPVQTWVFPTYRDIGFKAFQLTEDILDFFNGRIGRFPYAKLANVQSKTRYGGMENASCIFYSERVFRGSQVSERLVAHEMAHQWWGDSVTEANWDHIWLSEGFATYFTQLFLESKYGADYLEESMKQSRESIIQYAAKVPDAAVVAPAPAQLTRLLNTNSYQKGAWVLHMLRRKVGDPVFWQGIRNYYHTYQDRCALTSDFRRVMEDASNLDLGNFFRQWLYMPGLPQLRIAWKYDSQVRGVRVEIEQMQVFGPFRFDLDVAIRTRDHGVIQETLKIEKRSNRFLIPTDSYPQNVQFDPNVWLLMEAEVEPHPSSPA